MTIAPGDTRQLSTLSRLGLFGAVDLEQCSELLVKCSSKSLNPGQMLLYKDQENHSMYVIVDGHLGMHLQEDASAVVTLNPGDTVGEMSVIGGQATSAFVIAQSNCKVLEIPEKLLWEFVSSDLNFAKNLMKLFVKRMLDLNRLLYQRMHEEARSKIKAEKDMEVDKVIYLTEDNIQKTPEGEVLDILKLNKYCCRRHMLTHVDLD